MKNLLLALALVTLQIDSNADEMCDSMGKLAVIVYTQKAAGEDMSSIEDILKNSTAESRSTSMVMAMSAGYSADSKQKAYSNAKSRCINKYR